MVSRVPKVFAGRAGHLIVPCDGDLIVQLFPKLCGLAALALSVLVFFSCLICGFLFISGGWMVADMAVDDQGIKGLCGGGPKD